MARRVTQGAQQCCSDCGSRVEGDETRCSLCGAPFEGEMGGVVCRFCGAFARPGDMCASCGVDPLVPMSPPARAGKDPSVREIEEEQAATVLQPLVAHLVESYRKGALAAVRESAAAVFVTLDRAGVRPEREELEPVVVRDRIASLSKRLAQKVETVSRLGEENVALRKEIDSLRRSQTAVALISAETEGSSEALELIARLREALAAMRKNLGESHDEAARRALRAVEAMQTKIDEVLER